MKKTLGLFLIVLMIAGLAGGCAKSKDGGSFDATKNITVVSREDGSGTRGAFIELFGVEVKGEDGSKKDMTVKSAIIVSKTDVMMTNIANDPYAIGYISLGSLNNTIKAVNIGGVTASADNIKNGTYKISRPFNIATKGELSGVAKDFIDYILSAEGQKVVAQNNYIAIDNQAPSYAGSKPEGKIVVAGSSSVSPVMEKLKEAYLALNPHAAIEIQTSDSTAGLTAAINGTCNIGIASRELKASELQELTEQSIALDGIAVIVNNNNSVSNMTIEQVRDIFTGKITKWNGLGS